MWSSNLFFFCIQLFPSFFIVQVFQGPGFSESRIFRVQVFKGPGFSGSRFFRIRVQGLHPGFRSSQQTSIPDWSANKQKKVFSVDGTVQCFKCWNLDDGNIPCSFSINRQINYNIPPDIYLFKVNNRNARTMCEICPKLTTAEYVLDSRMMSLTLNK